MTDKILYFILGFTVAGAIAPAVAIYQLGMTNHAWNHFSKEAYYGGCEVGTSKLKRTGKVDCRQETTDWTNALKHLLPQ